MLQRIGQTDLQGSKIALGCMRMASLTDVEARNVLAKCLELGINFFDHADIYGAGESEQRFSQAMSLLELDRSKIILQSKCGIRQGYFDFSEDHILASVDGILKRLKTDYLDILALHRPDVLWEPEEVAEAFYHLRKAGKVLHLGVSNQNRFQMELLQSYLDCPLAVNQLQLSPAHTLLFDAGLMVNMWGDKSANRDGGVIDYCRLNKVTVQAWSPFQVDLSQGLFVNHPDYQGLTDVIQRYAEEYGVSGEAIVIAWILRHPAQIQTIVGSMSPDRLEKIAQASDIELSRPAWYDIYRSAGNRLP